MKTRFAGRPRAAPGRGISRAGLAMAGALFALVAAEAALRTAGLAFLLRRERANEVFPGADPVRVLCLGESTTMGQYPAFLEKVLNARGAGQAYAVIDKGVGGTNTGLILTNLQDYLDEYEPHIVVAMMGINDGSWSVPLEEGAGLFSRLVYRLKGLRVVKLVRLLTERRPVLAETPPPGKAAAPPSRPDDVDASTVEGRRRLGFLARDRGDYAEAERWFRKALELDPDYDGIYYDLGLLCRAREQWDAASDWFLRAVRANPRNHQAYRELGDISQGTGRLDDAERWFRKAIEADPSDAVSYVDLGVTFMTRGNFDEAERWFRRAMEIRPIETARAQLLLLDQIRRGVWQAPSPADVYRNPPVREAYGAVTLENYRKLRDAVLARGRRLVLVGYPRRSVAPLREVAEGREGIFVVDNQKPFNDALQRAPYHHYFADRFAGDFGHFTEAGNELLAENIANVILRTHEQDSHSRSR